MIVKDLSNSFYPIPKNKRIKNKKLLKDKKGECKICGAKGKTEKHHIKSKEPFDKRSAWLDLLMMVNHKKEKVEFDKKFIEVERGQKITSLEKLSTSWKWSRHKVSNFLNKLEQDGMLVQVRDRKKTLVSIENYNKYQYQKEFRDMFRDELWVRSGTS